MKIDHRLTKLPPLKKKTIRKVNREWFFTGENEEYWSNTFVSVTNDELDQLKATTESAVLLALRAVTHVAQHHRWSELGIPPHAIPLLEYSLQHERELHLVNRLDFAGGLERVPLKLLEFNADTCSLIPETALLQNLHYRQEQKQLSGEPYDGLFHALVQRFQEILNRKPDKIASLLIAALGHDEDWANCEVIADAARQAGFVEVQLLTLERVIFSREEGIFAQMGPDDFVQYDFFYKFFPWDWIAREEPELLDDLTQIITNDLATVLNPAYSMLLQSKGLLKIMHELEPRAPYLLRAADDPSGFAQRKYVRKPYFGRMGENIQYFDGAKYPLYQTKGDYGEDRMLCQELAYFNVDREDHRYQPSMFYTGTASALCFRRQDDLIIDDDAEFVPNTVSG